MYHNIYCEICCTKSPCDCGLNYFGDNKIHIDKRRKEIEESKKMSANDHQVGGDHYRKHGSTIQHWDYAEMKNFDKWQYQITKYVERWKDKNGILDLEKARHFLDKYIEVEKKKLNNINQVNFEFSIEDSTIVNCTVANKEIQNPFGFDPKLDVK